MLKVLLLVLFIHVSFSQYCQSVGSLSTFSSAADGTSGDIYSNHWVHDLCKPNEAINYDSGVQLTNQFQIHFLPEGLRPIQAWYRRNLNTKLEGNRVSFNMKLSITMEIAGNFAGRNIEKTYLHWVLTKDVSLDIQAVESFYYSWKGVLSTASPNGMMIKDHDTFDKVPPVVLIQTNQNVDFNKVFLDIEELSKKSISAANSEQTISIIPSAAIRNIFLTKPTSSELIEEYSVPSQIWLGPAQNNPNSRFSTAGVFKSKMFRCQNQKCSQHIFQALEETFTKFAQEKCNNFLIEDLESNFGFEAFVSSTEINVRSISANSKVLFSCPGKGFFSFTFSLKNEELSNVWPTLLFEKETQVKLLKSLTLKLDGFMRGKILHEGKLYSVNPYNIYGDLNSGNVFQDFDYPGDEYFLNFNQRMLSNLMTGIIRHDVDVSEYFHASKVSSIINECKRNSVRPTLYGCLFHYMNRFNIKFILDNNSALIYVESKVASLVVSLNDRSIQKFNGIVGRTFPRIDSPSQIQSSRFESISSAQLKLTNIPDPNFGIAPIVPIQWDASISIRIKFSNLQSSEIVYDYLLDRISLYVLFKLGRFQRHMTIDSNGKLVVDHSINAGALAAKLLENLKKDYQEKWIHREIPLINHRFGDVKENLMIDTLFESVLQNLPSTFIAAKKHIETGFLNLVCPSPVGCNAVVNSFFNSDYSIDFRFTKFHDLTVQIPKRNFFSRLSNTKFKVLARSRVLVSQTTNQYFIETNGNYEGFSVPFTLNMETEKSTKNSWKFNCNIPLKAEMIFEAKFPTFQSKIHYTNLLVNTSHSERTIGIPMDYRNNPIDVFDQIQGQMMNAVEFPLIHAPTPFIQNFEIKKHWDSFLQKNMIWFVSGTTPMESTLISFKLTPDINSLPILNITINNQIMIQCPISYLDRSSPDNTAKNLNDAFKRCNLGNMLLVNPIIENEKGEEKFDDGNYLFGIYSTFSTNWISDLEFSALASNRDIINNTFHNNQNPVFETNEELLWMMNSFFNSPVNKPQKKMVELKNLQIDPEVLRFYPQTKEALVYSTEIEFSHPFESSFDIFDQKHSPNSSLTFNIKEGSVNAPNLNIGMKFSFGNIFERVLQSTMISSDISDGKVFSIFTPLKEPVKFTLQVQMESRDGNNTNQILEDIHVFVPIGSSLSKIPELIQIPDVLKEILIVKVEEYDSLFQTDQQVTFNLFRKQKGNTLFTPVSIRIPKSNILELKGESIPSSSISFFKDFSSEISYSYSPVPIKHETKIGGFDVKASKVNGQVRMNITTNQKYPETSFDFYNPFEKNCSLNFFVTKFMSDSNLTFFDTRIKTENHLKPVTAILSFNYDVIIETAESLELLAEKAKSFETAFISDDPQSSRIYEIITSSSSKDFCKIMEELRGKLNQTLNNELMNSRIPFSGKRIKDIFSFSLLEKFASAETKVCAQVVEFSLEKFCTFLKDQWGTQICFNETIGEKSFQVTLKLNPYTYEFKDSIYLGSKLVGKHSMIGLENALSIFTQSTFQITLNANWESGKLDFSFLDGAFVEFTTKINMAGDAKVSAGPLSLTLAKATVVVGEPTLLSFKLILKKNGPTNMEVKGSGFFSAKLVAFGKELCGYSVKIIDIQEYLKDPEKGREIDQRTCFKGNVAETILREIKNSSLYKFFSNPGVFLQKWSKSLNGFLGRIMKTNVFKGLAGKAEPIIKFLLVSLVQREIRRLSNGKICQDLTEGLTEISRGIIMGNDTQVELTTLKMFTHVLCKLPLRDKLTTNCPLKVPDYPSGKYEWILPIGRQFNHSLIDFEIPAAKKANFANFKAKIDLLVSATIGFNIKLVYEPNNGFKFEFIEGEILFLSVDLPLGNNMFMGMLGFLGAGLETDKISSLKAKISISQDKGDWKGDYKLDSILKMNGFLGVAGSMKDFQNDKNPLTEYLHFRSTLLLEFSKGNQKSKNKFIVQDISLCFGHFLGRMIRDFLKKADKILGPLKEVVGKFGMLSKTVTMPNKRTYTFAELIIMWADATGRTTTDPKTIRRILQLVRNIEELELLLEKIYIFTGSDEGMCFVRMNGPKFEIDLETGKYTVYPNQIPDNSLHYSKKMTKQQVNDFEAARKFFENTEFGLEVVPTNFENIPKLFVNALLGIPSDLIKITLPELHISARKYFEIPVYCCPLVMVHVEFFVQLSIYTPKIVLTTEAFPKGLTTINLSAGMYIVSENEDGTARPIIRGTLRVSLAVSIHIFVLEVSISGYVELIAEIYLQSVNGLPRIRFDELKFLTKGLKFVLTLQWGVSVQIRLCFKICVWRKCWRFCFTVLRFRFGPYVLWRKAWGGDYIPPKAINQRGEINPNIPQLDNGGSIDIDDFTTSTGKSTSLDSTKDIPLSYPIKVDQYRFVAAPAKSLNIHIARPELIILQPSKNNHIIMNLYKQPEYEILFVNPNAVAPDKNWAGFQGGGSCGSLKLNNAPFESKIIFHGSICDNSVFDIPGVNVELFDEIHKYSGKTTLLNGASSILTKTNSQTYFLTRDSLFASNTPLFSYKEIQTLRIEAVGLPTTLTIDGVQDQTLLEFIGCEGTDTIVINDIFNGRQDMIFHGLFGLPDMLTASLDSGTSTFLLFNYTGFVTTAQKEGSTRSIITYDIDSKHYNIKTRRNTNTQVNVFSDQEREDFQLNSEIEIGGSVRVNMSMCPRNSVYRFNLKQGGDQTVYLGCNGDISCISCYTFVTGFGENVSSLRVVVDARNTPNYLKWKIHGNIIEVSNPLDAEYHMYLNTENIPNIEIFFSSMQSSNLDILFTAMKVNYFLRFPERYLQIPQQVLFCRQVYTSDIAIHGVILGNFEPSHDRCSNVGISYSNALGLQKSSVVFLPSQGNEKTNLTFKLINQVGQGYYMNESCIRPMDLNQSYSDLYPWTPMFANHIRENGISEQFRCEILYAPDFLNAVFLTGDGPDLFIMRRMKLISLFIDAKNGRNFFELNSTLTRTQIYSGDHLSKLYMTTPLGRVNATLIGKYGERNEIVLHAKGIQPELDFEGNCRIVKPLSSQLNSVGYLCADDEDYFHIIYY